MINIFISYSHQDEEWKDRLLSQIKILGEENMISTWENRQIENGDDWFTGIDTALKEADVALLLISADYLTSNFIRNKEIPLLMEYNEKRGLKILPVIVRPCPWQMVSWLSKMQVFPLDGIPLASGDAYEIEDKLARLVSILTKFPSRYETESLDISDFTHPFGYKVTITPAREKNLFEVCWTDIRTGTTNCFLQSGPDFTALDSNQWLQIVEEPLDTGNKLYMFLNGDSRYMDRALKESAQNDSELLLLLSTCEEADDWPFELLAQEKHFLLLNRIHLVRYVPGRGGERGKNGPKNSPLKLLFMACSPLDVYPELDFEREEEVIISMTENLLADIEVEDSGSLEGLANKLNHNLYDVVHLSGYANIDKNGKPLFIMEDDLGYSHEVKAEELWNEAIIENPPRLLFLSGSCTGDASENGAAVSFARMLAENYKNPAVLGWGCTVNDEQATIAAGIIYNDLSRGKTILDAVQHARYDLNSNLKDPGFPAWALLRLFGSEKITNALAKPSHKMAPKAIKIKRIFLKNSKVQVLATGFVGRRRQLQSSLKVLIKDKDKVGVLLYGTGGLGKSTLAGRLCERFIDHSLIIVHGRFNAITLELALKDAFILTRDEEGKKVLGASKEMGEKLAELCVGSFKEKNYLILLDDFEQNLDGYEQAQPDFISAEASMLLHTLLYYLPFSGKMTQLIVTSRYLFSLPKNGIDLVAERLHPVCLTGFNEAEQWKKARQLKHIMGYLAKNASLEKKLIAMGKGNPRLMEWIDILVGEMGETGASDLAAAVKGKHEEFIQSHILRELVSRSGEQVEKFLKWLSIYRHPISREGIVSISESAGLTRWEECLNRTVSLGLVEYDATRNVYGVTELLREELEKGLSEIETVSGHRNAMEYYRRLCEGRTGIDPVFHEEWIYHAMGCGEEEIASKQGRRLIAALREHLAFLESKRVGEWILSKKKIKCSTGHDAFLLNELANTIAELGDKKKAISLSEQALSIIIKIFGETHPHVVPSLNNLGKAWRELGEPIKAISYIEQAISIDERGCGKNHPNVARDLNYLGLAWSDLGDKQKAISLYEQALAIDVAVFGKEHPNVARDLNNLGFAYNSLVDYRNAISYYEQALAIDEKVYGREHPNVARELNNLGAAYFSLGDKVKAKSYLKTANDIFKKFFGDSHPTTQSIKKFLDRC